MKPSLVGRARSLLFIMAVFLLPGALSAVQGAPVLVYGEPESVGLSRSVLDGGLGIYREAIARGDLAGVVVLVARNGVVVIHEAMGFSDLEREIPMSRGAMFHMASLAKPVMAAGIATLVDQGRLSFDDPVRKFIPEWDNYRAGFISVRHLLTHTSGLRVPTFLEPIEAGSTLQREAARFGAVGAVRPPGETVRYSNAGFNTLAALIEIVSGMPLEDYLTQYLHAPLGMVDSYHDRVGHRLGGKGDRLGPIYRELPDGSLGPTEAPVFPFYRGSGGLISTAWDYAAFCQMFLNGGAWGVERVLEEETVAEMTSPYLTTAEGAGPGMSWRIRPDGSYGHAGGSGTDAWVDPGRGIIGVVLTQTPGGRPSVARFREIVNLALEAN